MITRVRIKNYKSIEEVDVQLGPLTVLVGRNGSGKSTFLDALKFVRDALRVGLENAVTSRGGMGSIQRWTPGGDAEVDIYLEVSSPNIEGTYAFRIRNDNQNVEVLSEEATIKSKNAPYSNGVAYPTDEEWSKREGKGIRIPEFSTDEFRRLGNKWLSPPSDLLEWQDSPNEVATPKLTATYHPVDTNILALQAVAPLTTFGDLADKLDGNFYSIFPNALRLPQKPGTDQFLLDEGENFVSVLQHVIRDSAVKSALITYLSQVAEGVDDIRVTQTGRFLVGELHHGDLGKNGDAPWFDLSQESDGTLRMLGLLTALYQTAENKSLLAIEEPELAIYPWGLGILAQEIHDATMYRQIVITTQSPDLISNFDASTLRLVTRNQGKTQISPIAEYEAKIIEEGIFSGGDLLRIQGLHGREAES